MSIDAQAAAIAPLVTQISDRFSDQLLGSDTLQITTNLPPNLPLAWGDPARIEQIIVNLLSNALRHTAAGEVNIRAYTQSEQGQQFLWIAVSDTGSGIAPEDIPHVFERFWRADRSRASHSGGSGVGLAICRRLVMLQGGQIKASSRLNKGSTFSFSLPTQPVV
ncbi:MAG: sensor histidine kinase [Phormidesmis sp.]